jgi:hypothetical protein
MPVCAHKTTGRLAVRTRPARILCARVRVRARARVRVRVRVRVRALEFMYIYARNVSAVACLAFACGLVSAPRTRGMMPELARAYVQEL